MGQVSPFQFQFSLGMKRDFARDAMPRGALWNCVDYIPDELGAPLVKRGGDTNTSNDISAVDAGASYVVGGAYVPFAGGDKNCAIDEDGDLYTIAANGTVTQIGAAVVPKAPLAFHREKLIITASDGTTAPKYYDGSTLGTLAGSPPAGIFGEVYKDRTVLARTSANPNRVFFSGPGDPTSWDTTNSWIDSSFPVTGLAALRNALLVFSRQRVERILGATPPPGTDMSRQTLFEQGCVDARSIVNVDDQVIFANAEGLYMTDGAAIVDVTLAAGMKRYWQELLSAYASTWTIAGGFHRGQYVCALMDGSTFKDAFLLHVQGRHMVRISNLKATSFWRTVGAAPECFYGSRSAARVREISSYWSPAAGVKNDADGTAVTPVLETGWNRIGPSRANVRDVYAAYDVRDAASDNPTLAVSYITSPEETSYTAVTGPTGNAYALAETTKYTRVRRSVRKAAYGVAFKIAQSNASSDTRIYLLEIDAHRREDTRV